MDNYQYGDMYEKDKYVRQRFDIYRELLAPYIKEGSSVLDIGCYSADLLKVLPAKVDYYGIDSDEQALKIAKSRGAKTARLDIENDKIPFTSKFDVIIAAEILEHLKDPEKLVSELKNLLKDDGVILISLPNECTIYHRIKVLSGRGIDGTGFAPYYHLHFPTIKQNDSFLEKHFKIIMKRYWFHLGVGGLLEKFLSIIPEKIWKGLVDTWPSLFARGVIYLCRK